MDIKENKKSETKQTLFLILGIFLVSMFIIGGTYAYMTLSVDINNNVIAYNTSCFDIVYDADNDNTPITGTLIPSSGPGGGLNGKISLGLASNCKNIDAYGNFNLDITSGGDVLFQTVGAHCENSQTLRTLTKYTDQESCEAQPNGIWVTEGTALKYAIYTTNNITTTTVPSKVGYLNSTGIVTIYENFPIVNQTVDYYVYIWLDGNLIDNTYALQSFVGGISVSASQIPIVGGEYTITFDTNGGNYLETTIFTTAGEHTYTVPMTGAYKLEVWGAQGGSYGKTGGYGGYSAGSISLDEGTELFVYVGQTGDDLTTQTFNGGGAAATEYYARSGGGATDIRLIKGTSYDEIQSLGSRIIIAGGGGGSEYYASIGSNGGSGGGLIGDDGNYYSNSTYSYTVAQGGTQITGGNAGIGDSSGGNGSFGIGGSISSNNRGGGGGGGYYGGGSGSFNHYVIGSGAGGSSYISGHTGCVAITSSSDSTPKSGCTTGTTDNTCSIHYSGNFFADTVMIDGGGYAWTNIKGDLQQMPNPNGGYYDSGVGHTGDGVARITMLNGSKTVTNGSKYGELPTPTMSGYTFLGWNTAVDGSGKHITSSSIANLYGDTTLYAMWNITTYTITYDANGGSGTPAAQTKTYGEDLTISDTIPTKDGYFFLGWSASSTATSATYKVGGTYSTNASVTLYAVWAAPVTPQLGQYISYTPASTSYTTSTGSTGYSSTQTINPSELNLWRVLKINSDGSMEIISHYVSSTAVYFHGSTGYNNYASYLNTLASQYQTSGITTGARHFGYTYPGDYNLVQSVLGTRVAYGVNATTTAKAYWMANVYGTTSWSESYQNATLYNVRHITSGGAEDRTSLFQYYCYYGSCSYEYWSKANPIRPIVTLKAGLQYIGEGTSSSPLKIVS